MINNANEIVNSDDDGNFDYPTPPEESIEEQIQRYGWTPELGIQQFYKQLADDRANPEAAIDRDLKHFLEIFAVLNYGGKTFIQWVDDKGELVFQSPKDFKEFNRRFWHDIDVDGKTKRVFVADQFLLSKVAARYQGIEFAPGCGNPNFLNLWKGWSVIGQEGDVQPFLDLIDALCDSDPACVEYYLNYLAHMIQCPETKPEVAIVMRGAQGIGKGSIMKLLKRLTENFKHLTSSNSLAGQFSGHLMDAFIIFADESIWGGDKAAEGRLKALITEQFVSIRALHKDEIQVKSFCRLFFASNEDWAAPVGERDRRYFVLDCSPRYKGQTGPGQFFDRFNKWMDNGGVEAVFDFLSKRDISSFNPRNFPMTAARIELQLRNFSLANRFIYELLSGSAMIEPGTVTVNGLEHRFVRNKLYQDFLNWCRQQQKNHPTGADEFGKAISKALDFKKDSPNWRSNWVKKIGRKNECFYLIPTIAQAQDRFAKNILEAQASQVFFDYADRLAEATATSPAFNQKSTVQPVVKAAVKPEEVSKPICIDFEPDDLTPKKLEFSNAKVRSMAGQINRFTKKVMS